jgi:hypothetical protein
MLIPMRFNSNSRKKLDFQFLDKGLNATAFHTKSILQWNCFVALDTKHEIGVFNHLKKKKTSPNGMNSLKIIC